jgi:hypothetical protein
VSVNGKCAGHRRDLSECLIQRVTRRARGCEQRTTARVREREQVRQRLEDERAGL